MKVRLLILLFFASLGFANSQSVIIEGGLSVATINYNNVNFAKNEKFSNNMGFHAGVLASFPIGPIFELQTGLILETKGWILDFNGVDTLTNTADPDILVNLNASNYYLELPVMIKENYRLKNGWIISAAVGGYVAYGLFGEYHFTIENLKAGTTQERKNDVSWGNDPSSHDLVRLDYGLSFALGLELSGLYIGLGYDLGLANILPPDEGIEANNRVFRVTAGYVIRKKKVLPMEQP